MSDRQAVRYAITAYLIFGVAAVIWYYISIWWALVTFLVGAAIGFKGISLSLKGRADHLHVRQY
jgi:hypothetical protein